MSSKKKLDKLEVTDGYDPSNEEKARCIEKLECEEFCHRQDVVGVAEPEILGLYNGWGMKVKCQNCKRLWFVCRYCNQGGRKRIYTIDSCLAHEKSDAHKRTCLAHDEKIQYKRKAQLPPLERESLESGYVPQVKKRKERNECSSSEQGQNDLAMAMNEKAITMSTSVGNDRTRQQRPTASPAEKSVGVSTPSVSMLGERADSTVEWIICRDGYDLGYERKNKSAEYFFHCHTLGNREAGMDYLVSKCQLRYSFQGSELAKVQRPKEQTHLAMSIAKLTYQLSRGDYQALVDVIQGAYQVGCEDGYACCEKKVTQQVGHLQEKCNLSWTLDLPEFSPELVIERAYTNSLTLPDSVGALKQFESKTPTSIVNNLPYPEIMNKKFPGHAVVSIVDCLRDCFSHSNAKAIDVGIVDDILLEDTSKVQSRPLKHWAMATAGRNAALSARALKKKLFIGLTTWSDDCDPHAFAKKNRGSVWVKTVTILAVRGDGNTLKLSYPIAIGKKGDSHDDIDRFHNEELVALREGTIGPFYMGSVKKKTDDIYCSHIAILQDQPERRGGNKLSSYNSTFHNRWSVSANHKKLFKSGRLAACAECQRVMEDRYANRRWVLGVPKCDQCLNWDALTDSVHALTEIPDHYPEPDLIEGAEDRTIMVNGKRMIKPFRITYGGLKKAVNLVQASFASGKKWAKNKVEAYLGVECINSSTQIMVLEHAKKAGQAIAPEDKQKFPCPASWDKTGPGELSLYIDTLMHMVFSGVVSTTIMKITLWLTEQSKKKTFLDNIAPLLDFAGDDFNISGWLKLFPFKSEKMGGWVSENYLAMARICLWFYQNLPDITQPVDDFDLPAAGMAVEEWTDKQMENWLWERQLDMGGSRSEWRATIAAHLCSNPNSIPVRARKRVQDVQAVLESMVRMIECIMSPVVDVEHSKRTAIAIRIFLSKYNAWDISFKGKTKKKKGTKEKKEMKKKQKKKSEEKEEEEQSPEMQNEEQSRDEKERKTTEMQTTRKRSKEQDEEGGAVIEVEALFEGVQAVPGKEQEAQLAKGSFIAATGNFAGLLNIPDAMLQYGPLPQFWEGDFKGEAYNIPVKDCFSGFRKEWQKNLMKNLHITKSFDNVLQVDREPLSAVLSRDALKDRSQHFHKYKSAEQVRTELNEDICQHKRPLSVVLLADGKKATRIFTVVENSYQNVLELELVHFSTKGKEQKFGLPYHEFKIRKKANDEDVLLWYEEVCAQTCEPACLGYGVLLPLLDREKSRLFSLISSHWKILGKDDCTILSDVVRI